MACRRQIDKTAIIVARVGICGRLGRSTLKAAKTTVHVLCGTRLAESGLLHTKTRLLWLSLIQACEQVGLLRLCLIEITEATHLLLLLRLLLLSASIEGGLPLRLLLLLILTHEATAKVLLLLLHAVEKHWLESTLCTRSWLGLHTTAKSIVLLHLLLLLHLQLHQLLLFLHALLWSVEIIHGLKRSILCGVRRCASAGVHHT